MRLEVRPDDRNDDTKQNDDDDIDDGDGDDDNEGFVCASSSTLRRAETR